MKQLLNYTIMQFSAVEEDAVFRYNNHYFYKMNGLAIDIDDRFIQPILPNSIVGVPEKCK